MIQILLRRVPSLTGALDHNVSLDPRETSTSGSAGFTEIVCPAPGTYRRLNINLSAAPGVGTTRTFTLYVNGSASALTVTLGAAATTATDLTNDVTVAAGDRLRLVSARTGTAATADVRWSIEYDSDDTVTSVYGVNVATATSGFADPLSGVVSGTAADCRRLIPCDGTFTSLVAMNTFGAVGAGVSLTFSFYLNGVKQDGAGGTVDTQCVVTNVAINTAITRTFTLPVVRGDDVYLGLDVSGAYPSSWTTVSCVFEADTANQSILANLGVGDSTNPVVNFAGIHSAAGTSSTYTATNSASVRHICGPTGITLGRFILEASDDPGVGNTRTFELMAGATLPANPPQGVVSNGSLLIDDTVYSAIFTSGSEIGPLRTTPAGWPTTTGREWWSFVMATLPPSPGGELPTPVEPDTSDIPVGVTRLFAVLTWGTGSPYSQIKVAETTFHFDPPSWYGGYGYPWLIAVSPITRELSDALQGVECTLTVADPERFFRGLATTDTLSGATWEIFLVSDDVRYALGEPHRRFAGRVHAHRAAPGLQYEFTLRDILSEELADLADSPRIPPGRLTTTLFPGMTQDYENRAIPIAIGQVSDDYTAAPQGVVPPLIVAPSINLQTAFGGSNVDVVAAIVSHGALPPNGLWTGYYNTINDPYTRIPIPAAAWGTLLTAPGMPGWNLVGVATDYIDYPADPTLTHRYTPVFFLASDPTVQAVVDGRIQVAFNLYGLTDTADGSGLYYADAPDIYEFLIRNWLYPPHWRYGTYNDTPTFLRGYTIVNHDSVVRSRDRLRAFTGSPGGYPVGFLLGRGGQQATLRHVLTELCHGVLMEQGIDRHGRIILDVEDVDAVATFALSDLHDIEDGEFEVRIDHAAYRNTAEYLYGYRYLPAVAPLPTPPEGETLPPVNVGPHTDWTESGRYTHAGAVAANDGKLSPPMQLENFVVRDPTVAEDWVARHIARAVGPSPSYDGPRVFRLTTSWQALGVELGDVIAIDHLEGLGASGYQDQRARVLKITDDLQQARITLEGRVLFPAGSP